MAQTWLPIDLASICPDEQAPLSECFGYVFLTLVAQLFGGATNSLNYPEPNPYSKHSKYETAENTYPSFVTHNDFRSNFDHHEPVINDSFGNLSDYRNDNSTENNKKKGKSRKRSQAKEYDFIIVGAGSAGCVLANRLSEIKQWRVLLLEAGPEEPDVTMVPALAPILRSFSIDWNYRTQPEPLTCRSIRGQTCGWPRGKTMGGSSAINFLVYMRGNRLDYDHWADLGNSGWSYNELLPYFKKSENNRNIGTYDTHYHGQDGPINVESYDNPDVNTLMLVKAMKETGLQITDLTTENNIGTNLALSTSIEGKRMSINVAYIKPIRDVRSNIDIIVNAFATKLIIDSETKTVLGVTYVKNGRTYDVFAKKEVIVSSGALNSPKLLMLSGIGPKDHLNSLHIPVIANLAVGKNLQDHVTTESLTIALSNKTSTLTNNEDILQEVKHYHQQKKKSGPLSKTSTVSSVGFIKTKYAPVNAPDIQLHFGVLNVKEIYSDPQAYLENAISLLAFYDGLSARPILLTPKSRGVVLLNNTDPVYGQPLIYPGFFTVKEDMDIMIEGMRYVVSLENTEAFKQNGAYYVKAPIKNCESYIWGSYDYFACLLIQYTATIFHPVGTCKMGPAWDREAVVDSRLRVYGVRRLRVIDASIMPFIVRGNTNIPTVTIAERASDMIKEDYSIKCP